MYMIRTPEPTASQGWGWQSGLVALRMGGFPSRSPGSPPLLTSALSRSPRKKKNNNFKNEKKQNKQEQNESVFKKAAIEQPRGGCGEITPTAAGRAM